VILRCSTCHWMQPPALRAGDLCYLHTLPEDACHGVVEVTPAWGIAYVDPKGDIIRETTEATMTRVGGAG
jgi:hypothetical protein